MENVLKTEPITSSLKRFFDERNGGLEEKRKLAEVNREIEVAEGVLERERWELPSQSSMDPEHGERLRLVLRNQLKLKGVE